MSGAAALEISNMLEGSTKSVEKIVRDSKEKIGKLILNGKEKIDTGSRVAKECEVVLSDIVSSVASVSKMVAEISSASQEQAMGVQEITKAIAQLDQVTQQNGANSSESANAAGTLSNQTVQLNLLVKKLVETIDGGSEVKATSVTHIPAASKTGPVMSSVNSIGKSKLTHINEKKGEPLKNVLPSSNDERFQDV